MKTIAAEMGKRIFDGVILPPKGCPRKLSDCQPSSRVASPEYESFMCCGETAEAERTVPTDRFRLCIKSTHQTGVDLTVNLDERDVVDTASVLLGALSFDAVAAPTEGGTDG